MSTTQDRWEAFLTTHGTNIREPDLFRRKDHRFRFPEKAVVTVTSSSHQTAPSRKYDCSVTDACVQGLSVNVNVVLTQGAVVGIRLETGEEVIQLTGKVVYCRRTGLASYRVGLSLLFGDD